ncbi:MAG: cellulase family glycosylhydrolase [Algiphilus sp.]
MRIFQVVAVLLACIGLGGCDNQGDLRPPLSTDAAKAAGAEVPPIVPDGRYFRDATGRTVIFQGIFEVKKPVSPEPDGRAVNDPDYAARLGRLGMNSVRLAYHWSALEPERGDYDEAYVDRVRIVVDKLAAEGVFVMLDSHQDMYGPKYGTRANGFPEWASIDNGIPLVGDLGFPGNYFQPAVSHAFDNLWLNTDGILDAYVEQLRFMASEFNTEPYLLGFDLMNEPWAGTQWPTCFNLPGCPQFDLLLLQPAMDAFAAAVRSQDPDAIVFYEPQFTFSSGAKTALRAPPEEVRPAGLSFHDLCVARAVRQIIDNEGFGTFLEQACDPFHTQVYINAFEASRRMDVTPFMTEVLSANERDTAGLECLLERAEDNKMSWNVGQYPSDSNNNTVVLARTFPRAVAGEIERYRFDPRDASFELVYQPDPAITAPTLIGVPVEIHYPLGYSVEVEGGRVLSEANAVRLLIEALPDAERVHVRLQPTQPDMVERPEFPACQTPVDTVLDVYQTISGG